MKKTLLALMAVLIVGALTACSSGEESSSEASSPEQGSSSMSQSGIEEYMFEEDSTLLQFT